MGYVFWVLKLQFIVLELPSNTRYLNLSMSIARRVFSSFVSTSKLRMSIDVHFAFLCKFLRVKSEKHAKTLSNIYIVHNHIMPKERLIECVFMRMSDP